MKMMMTLILSAALLGGCAAETSRGAAQGATTGAAAGAIGGMMSALVFGGDVSKAAARGAVWGGSTGAATGAMRGSQQAQRNEAAKARQQAQAMNDLKRRIGDDAFRGLDALADCRHSVAIAYAESAKQSSHVDHALAGRWLEIMAVAEDQSVVVAERMLPELVSHDPKLTSEAQARVLIGEVMDDLERVRVESGMTKKCT